MEQKNVPIPLEEFPAELHPFLAGAEFRDSSWHSNARTFYVPPDYYLKIDEQGELEREAGMGKWFFRHGLGPEVVMSLSRDRDYLLTRRAPGETALAFLDKPEELCRALAGALQELHGISPAGLPCSARLERYRASANDPDGGYWDESVLMPEFPISSRAEAWDMMQKNRHRLRQDTLIHGDFCLPNVILKQGRFSALIDLGLAGAGDRHIDLYWAVWTLRHYLKTGRYIDEFLRLYGTDRFDYDMLRVVAAFECFG